MVTKLMTTKQLAEALQVAENTLWRWRKDGMPYKKIGARTFRYDLDEIVLWLDKEHAKK